ncbi:mannose-P-dolichol utilization defect 1 protein homolog [Trichogramma pretiosum]|uniref:mannose-P-dolichol utilization defect 1 protein homolog n=1 Tax=Trichogramma pretiosum TaxID=7493 RepID=UPI0006C96CDC|nr:mannose-P-dolichol utilization defect 1 protein homolog [Trichogramma pretiosum]
MAKYLHDLASFAFTEQCMKEYFHDLNFAHVGCFKATLSKFLGLGIIAGSILVKVPQLLKIFHGKSAKGINVASVLLDLFAITAMGSYSYVSGFPFSAWGDAVFLGLQTVAIVYLVMMYNIGASIATAFLAAYASVIAAVAMNIAPAELLWYGQAMNIPVVLASKLMQAYTNYSNGSTGQLSAATGFMLFFGSLARIFTSVQETGDSTMILLYICSTAANGVIVSQLLYYWNVQEQAAVKSKKKK